MVNNQLELFAADEFVELEAVELDDGADDAAAALFAFAKRREAKGFGHASTYKRWSIVNSVNMENSTSVLKRYNFKFKERQSLLPFDI